MKLEVDMAAASSEKLAREIEGKRIGVETIARRVSRRPELAAALVEGMSADSAAVKFGCGKALALLSQSNPGIVHPHFDGILAFLESGNSILRWMAITILGNLAPADSEGRIDRVIGRYLKPISGPDLVSAANAIGGAAKIALAKPKLAGRIVKAMLKVESAQYATPECRNVALGQAVEALETIYPVSRSKAAIAAFIRRQTGNPRPSTAKRARKSAKRLLGE